jgi:hypothetical protein
MALDGSPASLPVFDRSEIWCSATNWRFSMDRNPMMIIAAAIALVLVLGGIFFSNPTGAPLSPTPGANTTEPKK